MKTISASEANRHFSTLLRDIASGEVVTVLSRGKPVATITPAPPDADERDQAKQQLLERLHRCKPSGSRNWTRNDLYED